MTGSARFALVVLALTLPLAPLSGGCGGDDPAEVHSYVDSAGRSCTVDVHDISGTATCDASASAAVTCAAGTEPVFVTSDDVDADTPVVRALHAMAEQLVDVLPVFTD